MVDGQLGLVHLEKGPFRGYFHYDTYNRQNVGNFSIFDWLSSGIIFVAFYMCMDSKYSERLHSLDVKTDEALMYGLISHYQNKEFFLSNIPPFGIQLYALFSNVPSMRYFSLTSGSLSISILYLIMRKVNVVPILAFIPSLSVACLPLFQKETTAISVESISWCSFLLTIFIWRSLKQNPCNIFYFISLSILVGIAASTKLIGLITLIWVICLNIIDFWNYISDLTVTTRKIVKFIFVRLFFVVIIPLHIVAIIYYLRFSNIIYDTPELSKYMSIDFQAYLRESIPTSEALIFGSTINLRHSDSLAGYLKSYNQTYETGSHEQMVSLGSDMDDEWNDWILEPVEPSQLGQVVTDSTKVKLRHKLTQKLLRASQAKPPISEQDYDQEVSCTGSAEYDGLADEYWTLYKDTGRLNENIIPLQSQIQLYNVGQGCYILSHYLLLPDWGHNDQEVICLASPIVKQSLFTVYLRDNVEKVYESHVDKLHLLFELIIKEFKYNVLIKNYKKVASVNVDDWPFYWSSDVKTNTCWFLSTAAITIFVAIRGSQLLKWNPWNEDISEDVHINNIIFNDVTNESMLGWFLHFYVFTKSPHDNNAIVNYIPSLLFGHIILCQILNRLYRWKQVTLIVIPFYFIVVFYLL